MDCPKCKNPLIILELGDIETDYCLECGGIWFDKGELELLLNSEKATSELLNHFNKDTTIKEKPVTCPICKKRMNKVYVDGNDRIIIDECPNGHGLWFDNGEILQLMGTRQLNIENEIVKVLTGIYRDKIYTKSPEEQ